MSAMKEHLNCLLYEARQLNEKYYQEWSKLYEKEFPSLDENGRYVPSHFYKHKPSAECECARQIYLTVNYFLDHVERANHYFKQLKAFLS